MQITETYAFLPREAVSKFLSLCTQCKKQPISENTGQKNICIANASNYYDNRYLTSNLSDTTHVKHERSIGLDKIKSDWEEKKSNSELILAENLSSDIGISNQTSRSLFKPYENNNNNKYVDCTKDTPEQKSSYNLLTPGNFNLNETINYYQLLTLFYHNFNLTNFGSTQKQEKTVNSPYDFLNKRLSPSNYRMNSETDIEKDSIKNSQDISVHKDLHFSCNELKIPTPTKGWTNVGHSPNSLNTKMAMLVTSTPEANLKNCNEHNSKENGSEAVKQMTSTYLSMTRSFGLKDDDALNLVSIYKIIFCFSHTIKYQEIIEEDALFLFKSLAFREK